MIQKKNIFTGSLGKLHNIGGSKCFSTPHTVNVPPNYEIETDIPSVAEFLTCSLNGRLWVFRRSRRFYVAVLRWDEENKRLTFASTLAFSNENIITRGIDWILSDKSLILSLDYEPYFSRTEFQPDDNTYIDAIQQSYSFFPELETWADIQYGITHINNSPAHKFTEITRDSLTPLEFHCYLDDNFLIVSDFKPQLFYLNGKLYAKGKAHIGCVSLLPQWFNENGEPDKFYLYISPDYLRAYDFEHQNFDDNDGWNKLILSSLTNDSIGIFTPHDDDNIRCKKAENGIVFALPMNKILNYTEHNGSIFFDIFSQSNLLVNDMGISFLCDNLSYECNGLRLWVAPNGIIDALFLHSIVSSINNSIIATHSERGFCRELFSDNTLPIAFEYETDRKFSLGISDINSKKYILVNYSEAVPVTKALQWELLFKQTVTIKMMKSFQWLNANVVPIYCAKTKDENDTSSLEKKFPTPLFIFEENIQYTHTYLAGISQSSSWAEGTDVRKSYTSGFETYNATIRYVDPVSGEFSPAFEISFSFPNVINTAPSYYYVAAWSVNLGTGDWTFGISSRPVGEEQITQGSVLFDFLELYIYEGKIGIFCRRREYLAVAHIKPNIPVDTIIEGKNGEDWPLPYYTNEPEDINSSFVFFPIRDVPEQIKHFIPDVHLPLEEQCGLMINDSIDYIITSHNDAYHTDIWGKGAAFLDHFHNLHYFAKGIGVWTNTASSRLFLNFPNSDSKSENSPVSKKNLHVMSWRVFDLGTGNYYQYLVVYFSEVFPDVFNFDAEFERSKFS